MEDWQNNEIQKRDDGSYIIITNGLPYHVPNSEDFIELWEEITLWLEENEQEAIPEPIVPPNEEELQEWKEQHIQAKASALLNNLVLKQTAETASYTDSELLAIAQAGYFDEWQVDTSYIIGKRIMYNSILYIVMQNITSQAHQPPDAEGMLAIYRPINEEYAGIIDDPIPFVYGMDVFNGSYYTYNNLLYLAKADMAPCIWPPDTGGLWQWELQPT